MKKDELLARYTRGLASSGKSRTIYLRHAREFLEYSDGDFSKESIDRYMNHLRKAHHYSDGSVNFSFRVIRTLFTRSVKILEEEGFEWPYRRGEAPQIRESSIVAPALHPDIIAEEIIAVKESNSPEEKAFLALSTTYGLRKTEMVELGAADLRIKDRTIHIATAKHGRERTHPVPEVIIPYLEEYDFGQKRSDSFVFKLYYHIEHRIKLPHTDQVGWHSIRRTLQTLLEREPSVSENTLHSFMRWKQRTSANMSYRYSAQTFVGRGGETTEIIGDALTGDSKVFEVHPFLKYWE